jgi:hypothetical protein
MSITWDEIEYQIGEWVEDGCMRDLTQLQSDVKKAIQSLIDKNKKEFETKVKFELFESLGLNNVTDLDDIIAYDYDFNYPFEFKWNKEEITIFKSMMKHLLDGDSIVGVYSEESDVTVLSLIDIEKILINDNEIILQNNVEDEIYFSLHNIFVIRNNTLSPLLIRFGNENCRMSDVFEQIECITWNEISGCHRDITFGEFKTAKLEKR